MTGDTVESALAHITATLARHDVRFALVGGLAVSIRAEVRFTRDVDVAVAVASDAELEGLVRSLAGAGYRVIAQVEHDEKKRLATVRLRGPHRVVVDLLAASSGIEEEVVHRARSVGIEVAGGIPVARAEELLALKVLSMTEQRPQDRIDALNLIVFNASLDLGAVRDLLTRIEQRGFHRGQDLEAKLDALLAVAPR